MVGRNNMTLLTNKGTDMTQKNIEGLIYYDVGSKQYFFGTFPKEYFVDGVWQGEHVHYIFVCDHTLTFDLPEGFDTVTLQLNALDAKEKELKIQYHQALEHIKVQRNNLLAIEG